MKYGLRADTPLLLTAKATVITYHQLKASACYSKENFGISLVPGSHHPRLSAPKDYAYFSLSSYFELFIY